MNRGAWQSTVHRVTKRCTWLKQLNMHAHTIYQLNDFEMILKWPNYCEPTWSGSRPCAITSVLFFLYFLSEEKWSRSAVSDSLRPRELWPTRLLHPWDFPGKITEVGCHFLLQEIFLTQGLNPGFPHCSQTLYRLSYQGSVLLAVVNFGTLQQLASLLESLQMECNNIYIAKL